MAQGNWTWVGSEMAGSDKVAVVKAAQQAGARVLGSGWAGYTLAVPAGSFHLKGMG